MQGFRSADSEFSPLFERRKKPRSFEAIAPRAPATTEWEPLSPDGGAMAFDRLSDNAPDLLPDLNDVLPMPDLITDTPDLGSEISLDLPEDTTFASEPPLPTVEAVPSILLSEHEAALADVTKHYDDLIEEKETQFQQEFGEKLVGLEQLIHATVREKIEQFVAPVLSEIALNALAEEQVKSLANALENLLKSKTSFTVTLDGPAAITGPIEAQLAENNVAFEVRDSDSVELSVKTDDVAISTSIDEWRKRLEEAIEQ